VFFAGLVVAVGLLGAGCREEPVDPSPAGVYRARCQRCHEVDGSSATASKQAHEEIDLRDPAFQDGISDQRIRKIARYGIGRMQGIAGITDEQLDSVVVFVRGLRKGRPPASATGPSGVGTPGSPTDAAPRRRHLPR